jgi:hypothetical protein
MFGTNKISNVVENAINSTNPINVHGVNKSKVSLASIVLAVLVVLVLNLVFWPWLWNNIARRLIPILGIARWYDTVALSILFGLIMSN